MGFIVRLHDVSESGARLVGRVPTAREAFTLMSEWRERYPESWVEILERRATLAPVVA